VPEIVDVQLAEKVGRLYADAETQILARIAGYLARGVDAPDWETTTLARLQNLRREALADLARANAAAADEISAAVAQSYSDGNADVYRDLADTIDPVHVSTLQQRAAVRQLADELTNGLQSTVAPVLRRTEDAYRSIVGEVVATTAARGESRRAATQRVLNRFADEGVATFRDSAGRQWHLDDYANMAVRTGQSQALIRGHEDVLDANGLDLVVVQPGPRACSVCDRFARQILSRSGARTGALTVESMTTGRPLQIVVDGTLALARAAGFQHPNCRCRLRAYLPGATDPSVLQRPPWDREGYEAQQQQRAIERKIRAAKRREAVAVDPDAKRRATAEVQAGQLRMRQHLDEHPQLKRRSDREQVRTGATGTQPPRATRSPAPRTPAPAPAVTPEPKFVDSLTSQLESGKMTPAQLRKAAESASPLGQANARAAIERFEQRRAVQAPPEPPATGRAYPKLADEARDALQPKRGGWTTKTSKATIAKLNETPQGRSIAKTLKSFQSGGATAIPRLRTDIESYLSGGELAAGRVESIENLLGAINSSEADRPIYRGMVIPGELDEVLARYSAGDRVDLSLASFTSDRKTAVEFSTTSAGKRVQTKRNTPVVLEVVGRAHALPIENISPSGTFAQEREWITSGRYRVKESRVAKRGGADTVVVQIEEVETWQRR